MILARNYANCIVRRQITGEVSNDGMKIKKSMAGRWVKEKEKGKWKGNTKILMKRDTEHVKKKKKKKRTRSGQYVFKDDNGTCSLAYLDLIPRGELNPRKTVLLLAI